MGSEAADPEILKPRVPADQIEEAKTWKNPLAITQENIKKGKIIFHEKAFCVTCHGKDGKGYDKYSRSSREITSKLYRQGMAESAN
jgi:cytochrome c